MNAEAGKEVDLFEDIPRGRHAKHVGMPPHSHFESTQNLAATESLSFDPTRNRQAKVFLGVVNGRVVTGGRLADGGVNRYVIGGTPLAGGDDRHKILLASSRSGK